MEALIIIAASLLVGLIFLLASERQIASNRKNRDLDHDKNPPSPRHRRFQDEEYDDIFYPRRRRSPRLRRASEIGYEDSSFYDYEDFSNYEREAPRLAPVKEKRQGNVIGAYFNVMVILFVAYMLLKYFAFV